MHLFLQLTILAATLVSPLIAKETFTFWPDIQRRTESTPPWYEKGVPADYDCSGKEDGNYMHPTTCTMYIACVNQTIGYEMLCPMSEEGELLHFVVEQGPDPRLTPCDRPDVAKCPTIPTPSPTTTTTTTTTTPPPGSLSCDPNCQLEGYCQDFARCVESLAGSGVGSWVNDTCGSGLFWNREKLVCDYFDNLSDKDKYEYSCDRNCIEVECKFFQYPKDECSPNYSYQKKFDGINFDDRIEQRSCPSVPNRPGALPLFWDQSSWTCDKCSRVTKADGTPCVCHQILL